MQMPGRKFTQGNSGYRYGFNGKEKDNSTGEGNLDYGDRVMDVRLGRWLSIDPEFIRYPSLAPYQANMNNPIYFKDKDGRVLTDPNGNVIYEVDKNSRPANYTYGNYKVTIQEVYVFSNKNEKIKVQHYIVTDKQTGRQVSNSLIKQATNCHGHSSLKDKFRVNSSKSESNALLLDKAGLNQTDNLKDKVKKDLSSIQSGDIVVLFNNSGVAVHSFTYEGNKKVSSKNGELGINEFPLANGGTEVKPNATVKDIATLYNSVEPGGVTTGFFTPVPDKKVITVVDVKANYEAPADGTVEKVSAPKNINNDRLGGSKTQPMGAF